MARSKYHKVSKRISKKSKSKKNKAKCSLRDKKHSKAKAPSVKKMLEEVLSLPPETVILDQKHKSIKELENEVLQNPDILEDVEIEECEVKPSRDMLEQIMFKLPHVMEPLVGTPKEVQKTLDALVKKMQKKPADDVIFDRIHLYMHGYLINVVLKKFPFIQGLQTVDIYQETLIALRFKAIPNFKKNKGMSFLNFAKMCIRRHLITLLNTSKTRKKDQSINRAFPIDTSPIRNDGENRGTYATIIPDKKDSADKAIECSEAYEVTKDSLLSILSDFERVVLSEYLSNSSYREISKDISSNLRSRYNTKSIDNALLRIRKKAMHLKKFGKREDLPLFLPRST